MAVENFVQPAIPRFDGHYDHWSMLMENFLRSKEYWHVVESGITEPEQGVAMTDAQKTELEALKLKDLKAKNYLFQAIDRVTLETILCKDTSKQIWDSMKRKHQGNTRAKRAQLQSFRTEFENLRMKSNESVTDFLSRTMVIANKMRIHGEKMEDVVIIEKILRLMTAKFNFVVCSIEESRDVGSLTLDELQSSLLVHEQKIVQQDKEEHALKAAINPKGPVGGKPRWKDKEHHNADEDYSYSTHFRGKTKGRDNNHSYGYKQKPVDKSKIECYRCHRYGHYKSECRTNLNRNRGVKSNFAEKEKEEEISLLMACHGKEEIHQNLWYLDTGCSNHMCGDMMMFSELDEAFRSTVSFGDNSKVSVMGKGNVKIHTNENTTQVISNVFFVPDLKTNLLSVGQLQEKGYEIFIKDGVCRIQDENLGLIAQVNMTTNWMFPLYLNNATQSCFSARMKNEAWLWHFRYGHLNFGGLKLLQQKRMVTGLLKIESPSQVCEECVVGKQHRDHFPKGKSTRAKKVLELIHTAICGPINPTSNGVVNWSIHVLNRSPTITVQNMTPEEAWSGKRPSIEHFRIFGCVAYAHIPDQKRTKLDEKAEKCIFLGVSEQSKAYKLYNPITKKIVISRDVIFDEEQFWFGYENNDQGQILADFDGEDGEQVQQPLENCDPTVFEDAVKDSKWRKAMDDEIVSIEKNNTWELTDLPEGQKTIGVKWVYKTKLKENGEIDKYKARLVAKGYKQEFDVDYKEVFTHVARHDTIRLVISLAAQNSWPIFQLDVKSAFLHGDLKEQVFVDQLPGYVKLENENKVYRLKKALYGLKQAPRAWYSRIEAYFLKEGFQKCPYEHMLFTKVGEGDMLDKFGMKNCNHVCTPTEVGLKLVRDSGGKEINNTSYKQIVGSLMYLTATRPDIMHAVSLISRFMECPKEMHLLAAKRILRYLKGTASYGLFYKRGEKTNLFDFTDSDYAGDLDDRKSTSGYAFMLGTGVVSWSSKKQPIVTLSTTEAEFVAATAYASQAIWLRNVLEELHFLQQRATTIFCDNNSAIKLSKNPVLHRRSKHIDVKFHYLRDLTNNGVIDLVFCRSEDQVADIFTKSLKRATFHKLRKLLGVYALEDLRV
ncbi:hypothetical protein HRI_000304000 [Hibiscus trionum]|uniref:CCHC-type domain-containing protein n=1 Tax=Hibiscus trionum TaxID=183268 RepID=A0A9W7LJ93_HIBTR|nr:hypothetical protein HRI_000304000 [Hibiscus trionum]